MLYEVITDVLYYESLPSSSGVWATKATGFANYDWYDEWYGSSLNQQHNVSISGGEEKTSYYISGGMIDQNGILNYGIDNYKRYNLSAKINTALTDWWDVVITSYSIHYTKLYEQLF